MGNAENNNDQHCPNFPTMFQRVSFSVHENTPD